MTNTHTQSTNYSRRMASNNIRLLYCTQIKKTAHKCREIIRKGNISEAKPTKQTIQLQPTNTITEHTYT